MNDKLEYWINWCWKKSRGNHEEYARLMRIFARKHEFLRTDK